MEYLLSSYTRFLSGVNWAWRCVATTQQVSLVHSQEAAKFCPALTRGTPGGKKLIRELKSKRGFFLHLHHSARWQVFGWHISMCLWPGKHSNFAKCYQSRTTWRETKQAAGKRWWCLATSVISEFIAWTWRDYSEQHFLSKWTLWVRLGDWDV